MPLGSSRPRRPTIGCTARYHGRRGSARHSCSRVLPRKPPRTAVRGGRRFRHGRSRSAAANSRGSLHPCSIRLPGSRWRCARRKARCGRSATSCGLTARCPNRRRRFVNGPRAALLREVPGESFTRGALRSGWAAPSPHRRTARPETGPHIDAFAADADTLGAG